MKKLLSAGMAAAMLAICGCRSQIVTVDVFPPDATVVANGVEYHNKSPMFIEACTGRPLLIIAYKEGYREKAYAIDYTLSTLGTIEAIGSILVLPAFGLCFDNAWELKESNVALTLEPVSEEAKKEAAESVAYRVRRQVRSNPVDISADPNAKKTFSEL